MKEREGGKSRELKLFECVYVGFTLVCVAVMQLIFLMPKHKPQRFLRHFQVSVWTLD